MVALAAINNNPIKNTIGELRIIIPRRNTTNIDPSARENLSRSERYGENKSKRINNIPKRNGSLIQSP